MHLLPRSISLLIIAFLPYLQGPLSLNAEGTSSESIRELRGLSYRYEANERQKLDLYLPPRGESKLPLLIWIHGGGWAEGTRGFCPLKPLVNEGYAVASISYRLAPDSIFPAQLEDCRAAVEWLRTHADQYGVDGQRIGVAGESAGGHLAALLGVTGWDAEMKKETMYSVQAVVSLCPPVDLTVGYAPINEIHRLLKSNQQEEIAKGQMELTRKQIMERFLGGPVKEHQELAQSASPLYQVSSHAAPFLLVHGDMDALVPIEQSKQLKQALNDQGVDAELYIVHGAGHGFGRFSPAIFEQVQLFFDQQLKPAE